MSHNKKHYLRGQPPKRIRRRAFTFTETYASGFADVWLKWHRDMAGFTQEMVDKLINQTRPELQCAIQELDKLLSVPNPEAFNLDNAAAATFTLDWIASKPYHRKRVADLVMGVMHNAISRCPESYTPEIKAECDRLSVLHGNLSVATRRFRQYRLRRSGLFGGFPCGHIPVIDSATTHFIYSKLQD